MKKPTIKDWPCEADMSSLDRSRLMYTYGVRTASGEDTGIYQTSQSSSGPDPRAQYLWLREKSEQGNVNAFLSQLPRYALEIVVQHSKADSAAMVRAFLTQHNDNDIATKFCETVRFTYRNGALCDPSTTLGELSKTKKNGIPRLKKGEQWSSSIYPHNASPIVKDAIDVVYAIYQWQTSRHEGNSEKTISAALRIGMLAERLYVRPFEDLTQKGRSHYRRICDNLAKMNKRTPEEHAKQEADVCSYVQKLRDENPTAKALWIYKKAADEFNISPRTVMRFIKSSHSQEKK